jgi:hypothetical protein
MNAGGEALAMGRLSGLKDGVVRTGSNSRGRILVSSYFMI